MSPRARAAVIVAALLACGIAITAVRGGDAARSPDSGLNIPVVSSASSGSLQPATTRVPAAPPTTATGAGHGPIAVTCTPNGDGSFAASFTSPWPDGYVEQGAGTIAGDGLKTVTGDRGTISYFFIKTVDLHPTCRDYN